MSKINYIKHLKGVYEKILDDTLMNPSHVSLYMALFQLWNLNRFTNPFFINRGDVMRLSKIGSKTTYHRCIRDLHSWKYIIYEPSQNPLKSSQIHLTNFGTSSELVVGQVQGQVVGQALVSNIKHTKHIKQSKLCKQENQNSDFLKVENNKDYNQPL